MAYDKKLHLACGFAIALIIGLYNVYYGAIASVLAGIGKEIYDYYDYGLFDVKDMLFTWIGSILGTLLAYVIIEFLT